MPRFIGIVLTTACFAGSIPTAMAQSSDFGFDQRSETQARMTLTIPFGATVKSHKDDARLEFGIRQYEDRGRSLLDHNWALNHLGSLERDYYGSSVGFTLSKNVRFLVNGQDVKIMQTEMNLNTTEKVAIGVVVIGGVIIGGTYLLAKGLSCDVDDDC